MLRARFRRWCHQMWGLMRPWRWQKRGAPPCRAITEQIVWYVGPLPVRIKTLLVACECNWVFGKATTGKANCT